MADIPVARLIGAAAAATASRVADMAFVNDIYPIFFRPRVRASISQYSSEETGRFVPSPYLLVPGCVCIYLLAILDLLGVAANDVWDDDASSKFRGRPHQSVVLSRLFSSPEFYREPLNSPKGMGGRKPENFSNMSNWTPRRVATVSNAIAYCVYRFLDSSADQALLDSVARSLNLTEEQQQYYLGISDEQLVINAVQFVNPVEPTLLSFVTRLSGTAIEPVESVAPAQPPLPADPNELFMNEAIEFAVPVASPPASPAQPVGSVDNDQAAEQHEVPFEQQPAADDDALADEPAQPDAPVGSNSPLGGRYSSSHTRIGNDGVVPAPAVWPQESVVLSPPSVVENIGAELTLGGHFKRSRPDEDDEWDGEWWRSMHAPKQHAAAEDDIDYAMGAVGLAGPWVGEDKHGHFATLIGMFISCCVTLVLMRALAMNNIDKYDKIIQDAQFYQDDDNNIMNVPIEQQPLLPYFLTSTVAR